MAIGLSNNDARQHVANLIALEILIAENLGLGAKTPTAELGDKVAAHIADMAARHAGYPEHLGMRSGQTLADVVTGISSPNSATGKWLIDRKLWDDVGHRAHWEPYLSRDDRHVLLSGRPARKAQRMPLSNPVRPSKGERQRKRPLRHRRPELQRRRSGYALQQMYRARVKALRDEVGAAIHLATFQFASLRVALPGWYAPYLEQMPDFEAAAPIGA